MAYTEILCNVYTAFYPNVVPGYQIRKWRKYRNLGTVFKAGIFSIWLSTGICIFYKKSLWVISN